MPIIIRCHSCGFVLYRKDASDDKPIKDIEHVLREWGYKCPVCGSPLSKRPINVVVTRA